MNTPNGMPVHMVDTDQAFAELCSQWSKLAAIAVDTEFVRTNTFYPRIGLLQVADNKICYLIDPLSVKDWAAFKLLLLESDCTLVLHSCGEDMNLLQTSFGYVPSRIFDTQIAAAFLGFGFSLSYQALVKELLDLEIAKDETRSDWLRRPLSETQLQYAAIDVCHLLEIQKTLQEKLEQQNRWAWFLEECANLQGNAAAAENSASWDSIYTGISNAWQLDDRGLCSLKKLAIWREKEARERDKPRNWIAKDADLLAIAELSAQVGELTSVSLGQLTLSNRELLRRYGTTLVELLSGQDSNEGFVDRDRLLKPLPALLRKKLKRCQQVARAKAQELMMAPELLAKKKQIQEMLREYSLCGEINWRGDFAGWRRELLEIDFRRIIFDET